MNILITNHHLNLFGGSETFTFTLAKALKKHGHRVEILTAESGAVAEKLIAEGIPVHISPETITAKPDVIHAHHNVMAMIARAAFHETPLVFLSHGIVPGLESPPSINTGIALFAGVSEETVANLEQNHGIVDPVICRNGIDLKRHFPLTAINPTLKKVLIISNHYSQEQLGLVQGACDKIGATLSMIGLQTQSVWETEQYINENDLVISLGRGCLEAMACGRAAFIFDHHGGDGFITSDNYHDVRKHNFSGRRFRNNYTLESFTAELATYKPEMGAINRTIIEENHDIHKQIPAYLEHYQKAMETSINFEDVSIPASEILFYQNAWRERVQIMNHAIELNKENNQLKEQLSKIKPRISKMMHDLEAEKLKVLNISSGKVIRNLHRSFKPVGNDEYTGENLVFIFGPPRSGTTWVLSMLKEHADVIAANVDNLKIRTNENATLETGIFLDEKDFSDDEIYAKFRSLSKENSGKVIVEKTPNHVSRVSRIAHIFKDAAFILLVRDGRDVSTSILEASRMKDIWWSGGPSTIADACEHWRDPAEAGIECQRLFSPHIIRYEEMLDHPLAELTCLNKALGLSFNQLEEQVNSSKSGKNIPIKGVFRKGISGDWKNHFSPEDVEIFKSVAGETLIKLGYEKDNSWSL